MIGNVMIESNVLTAATNLHDVVVDLQGILNEIDIRMLSLPEMQFTITDGMTPAGVPNGNMVSTWINVRVSNYGLFSPITTAEIEQLLRWGGGSTEMLLIDEFIGSGYNTHAWSNGTIPTQDLLNYSPIVSGPGAGLYNLDFDILVTNVRADATNVRVRLLDELNRIGVKAYNLAQ